jgi:hypothetical protein
MSASSTDNVSSTVHSISSAQSSLVKCLKGDSTGAHASVLFRPSQPVQLASVAYGVQSDQINGGGSASSAQTEITMAHDFIGDCYLSVLLPKLDASANTYTPSKASAAADAGTADAVAYRQYAPYLAIESINVRVQGQSVCNLSGLGLFMVNSCYKDAGGNVYGQKKSLAEWSDASFVARAALSAKANHANVFVPCLARHDYTPYPVIKSSFANIKVDATVRKLSAITESAGNGNFGADSQYPLTYFVAETADIYGTYKQFVNDYKSGDGYKMPLRQFAERTASVSGGSAKGLNVRGTIGMSAFMGLLNKDGEADSSFALDEFQLKYNGHLAGVGKAQMLDIGNVAGNKTEVVKHAIAKHPADAMAGGKMDSVTLDISYDSALTAANTMTVLVEEYTCMEFASNIMHPLYH